MIRPILAATVLLVAAQSAAAQPPDWRYVDRGDGLHLRVLRDYHLAEGDTAREPILVIGASATIDGRAEDDVVVIGGTLRVGPKAVVRGDILTVGGEAIIDRGAETTGQIDQAVAHWPDVDVDLGRIPRGWWAAAALGATVLRLSVVLIVSMLLTLIAPGWIDALGRRASATIASAFVGITSQVLFTPGFAIVVTALAVSIVGIPLLGAVPFFLAGAALVWAAGFTAVAARVGSRLRGTGGQQGATSVFDVLVGTIAIASVTLAAHVGTFGPGWIEAIAVPVAIVGLAIEYLAWTVGLGAAVSHLFGRRAATAPPSLPAPMAAPSVS